MPAAIPDVDDAPFLESDLRSEASRAKRQRDLVAGAKMFLDQRGKREIGKDIAAVNEKSFVGQETLRIFDPTAGLEQHRLVHQLERDAAIRAFP